MEFVKLGPENQEVAIDIFARAFHDDPALRWISTDPGFLQRFFELTLPVFLPQGLSYMTSDESGAAAWLGPGTKLEWPFTLANIWKAVTVAGLGGLLRFGISGMKTEKCHPREPHYYLFLIGAVPESQGQGIGTALMSKMLRRCDQEQMPAYLENSKEANLAFYKGHGFKVLEEIRFTRNAPPIWLMWRDPQPLN